MTQVDFYILDSASEQSAGIFTCRLTEKAYRAGMKVFIHAPSMNDAKRLDDLLWTYNQGSFLPHGQSNQHDASADLATPIMLGTSLEEAGQEDLLINLTQQLPAESQRFQRIAEVIVNNDAEKQAARQRFRHYRDQGFEVKSHNIVN